MSFPTAHRKYKVLPLWWLLSTILTIIYIPAVAQPDVMLDHYREVDGLSHRWVRTIRQDTSGFLWVGTYDGLNRFDGNTFVDFRPPQLDTIGARHFLVQQLYCDRHGMFWIKSRFGYFFFNPYTLTYRLMPKEVGLIFVTDQGNPYVWFDEGKYDQLSATDRSLFDSLHLRMIPHKIKPFALPLDFIREVSPDLLVGYYAKGPSIRIDLKQGSFAQSHDDDDIPDGFLVDPITNNNLVYFDPHSGTLTSYTMPDSLPDAGWNNNYVIDNAGNYWFQHARFPHTYFLFNVMTREFSRGPNIGDMPFEGIYVQEDGVVWLGHEQGLSRFTTARKLFQSYLSKPFVIGSLPPIGYSVREMWDWEDGKILVNSNYLPFIVLDPGTGTTTRLINKNGTAIYPFASFKASDTTLWFLQPDGRSVHQFHVPSKSLVDYTFPLNNNVYAFIAVDANGHGWLHRGHEILKTDPSLTKVDVVFDGAKQSPVVGMFMVSDRTQLVFRFADTVAIMNCQTHAVQFYRDTSVKAPMIEQVYSGILQGDTIWMTTTTGLYTYHLNNGFSKLYTRKHGLVHAKIYTVLPDGQYLWLGTHDGLVRFDKRTESIRTFSVLDGLPHHEFNSRSAHIAADGSYYMGGLNGIIRFYPRQLDEIPWKGYQLVLSAFEKNNTDKNHATIAYSYYSFDHLDDGKAHITLKPWENDFTIHYALTDYSNVAQHSYMYYLEGIEQPWSHLTRSPQAVYQDLRPGKYVFYAKAVNARGLTSNELSFHIYIAQYWYRQWWAWTLYALGMMLLVITFYRYQVKRKLAIAESTRLRELDQFKTRFYTNITHEFRTPLTVILGMNESLPELHRKKETGKIDQAVKMIRRNSRQLLRLVGQILDLSKIDSGSLKMDFEQGDVIPYLRYLSESFRSLAATKGVELHFLSEEKEYVMAIDREKLLHIITNLVSNAVKFTPRDGHIYLQVEQTMHRDAEALRIKVRDTGAGIAPESLPMIFDRFYAANVNGNESAVVQRGMGAGIGLALVKELVRLWKGDISVESTLGKGSTFTIVLPRNYDPDAVSELEFDHDAVQAAEEFGMPSAVSANMINSGAEQFPLLLIAEDNVDVVHYLTTCLDQEYRILIAHDGKEGMEKAVEYIPDVIISDVMMPEMDGFELCYSIKHDQRTSHIPVILLTAKEDTPARLTGLRKGADAYLTKPFNPEELHIRLQKLVELRNTMRQKFASYVPSEKQDEDEKKNPESQFLRSVHNLVHQHMDDANYGILQLCRSLGLSQSQLFRKLKALTGKSTAIYIRSIRLAKGKELLTHTDRTVSEIAYEVGFSDPAYFSRCFSEEFGKPPVAMRN